MAKKGFEMKRDPFSNNSIRGKGSIVSSDKYESIFNYEQFKMIDLKEEFVEYEKNIIMHGKRTAESIFEISKTLYQANQKLANRGNGSFTAWCENLGLSREMTSIFLKRYNLFLELNDNKEKIMMLPVRALKELTKKDSDFTVNEVIKVLESKKPTKALEKVKEGKSLSNGLTNSTYIIEAEIVETEEEKKQKELEMKVERLKYLDKDIQERERNLKKLKKEREQLAKELENANNLKLAAN